MGVIIPTFTSEVTGAVTTNAYSTIFRDNNLGTFSILKQPGGMYRIQSYVSVFTSKEARVTKNPVDTIDLVFEVDVNVLDKNILAVIYSEFKSRYPDSLDD
jgi:hypothetical protein